MHDSNRLLFGGILLILGIAFLLDTLGIAGIDAGSIISLAWPLILVYFGLQALQRNNTMWGLIITGIGALFLVSNVTGWNAWDMLWPIILIIMGLSILMRRSPNMAGGVASISSNDVVHESAMFWGSEQVITSQNFQGGSIDCTFGGVKLDLRQAKIAAEGANLTVNCTFGGVEIYVPKGTRVEIIGSPLFGGIENTVPPQTDTSLPALKITASPTFGGLVVHE